MNHDTLKNKHIIIIGGSSGIGYATAKLAHAGGALVSLTSRNAPSAAAAAESIGQQVEGYTLNIDNEKAVNVFFADRTGVDHIYIAAGGTAIGAVTAGGLDTSMHSFNTRLLGSLRIVRAAAAKINPFGSIVFTGGISTDRPIAGAWVAGLGTAAAEQLARVLVLEFPSIRFNAVSPGYTDTPMWDEILGDKKKSVLDGIAERIPVKKIAAPEEVAAAVLFLMSNQSVNGETIHVDGGARLI